MRTDTNTDTDTTPGMLLYAYAVARDADLPAAALTTVTEVEGVTGRRVRAVRERDLVALVEPVPAAEFDEAPLREHLEDLAWLERVARGHQRVVDAATALACVLPLRLATVYRDEAGVRRMLTAGHEELTTTLGRLDGRDEWAVKVWIPPRPEPEPSPLTDDRSGRGYLARRGAEARAREAARRHADETADSVHSTLLALAEEARLHPTRDNRLSGRPGRNVLNAAYLVRRERSHQFRSAVGTLAEHPDGPRVELSGPWAPYSFVTRGTP
ncbi:GvpL/GvpF family gas vesicle protein [Streptomyces sp. NPDC001407]|uniref:GvpL/GvpF family gas vesicle protein n=1 Tax=unclassified Streptomyces TaxID=2593676 RepID=UPI0033E0297C